MENNVKKSPVPEALEQVRKRPQILNQLYSEVKKVYETSDMLEVCELLKTEKWICLKIFIKDGIPVFVLGGFE